MSPPAAATPAAFRARRWVSLSGLGVLRRRLGGDADLADRFIRLRGMRAEKGEGRAVFRQDRSMCTLVDFTRAVASMPTSSSSSSTASRVSSETSR